MIDRSTIYRARTLVSPLLAGLALLVGCSRGPEEPKLGKPATNQAVAAVAKQDASPAAMTVANVSDTAAAQQGVVGVSAPAAVTVETPAPETAAPRARKRVRLSAPISLSLTAKALAKTMTLNSDSISVTAGFLCSESEGTEAGDDPYTLKVRRFALSGRTDSLFRFEWVASMDNDEGRLTGRPTTAGGRKGYEVTLRGPLHLTLLIRTATQPLRLHTRDEVVLQGFSPVWPPRRTTLSLVDGPVKFYQEKLLHDSTAGAMVLVEAVQAEIGGQSSSYFDRMPRITRAAVIDAAGAPWRNGTVGGVRLEWAGVPAEIGPVRIAGYNVYRSSNPADPSSWHRIATLPATQTSYEDRGYDGHSPVSYLVAHRAQYPTGFEYEGSYPAPTVVKEVLR